MSRIEALPGLDPAAYRNHGLHGAGINWVEKNCYVDLWVEFLHTLGLEPRAMLPFTVAMDFEGDQWTFFKPPLAELRDLYGIDVQELTVWKPLVEHVAEHLAAGKLISTETDAFWLPDTAGTDYRLKHTKTTIMIASLDAHARKLGYFHNAGYHQLGGDDFVRVFRLDMSHDPAYMPQFAEMIRIDRMTRRGEDELAAMSMELLRRHFAWRPRTNPFTRFAVGMMEDLPVISEAGMAHYHLWAFATIRQAGAAFELLASNLRWLQAHRLGDFSQATSHFESISRANTALILKGARAAHTGRALDVARLVSSMEKDWDEGMALIAGRLA